MENDMAALGVRVRLRRDSLGLSQEAVEDLWGPSTTTLSKIESGESKSIRRRTAADLERSLGWKAGAVELFLHMGIEPQVVEVPVDHDDPPIMSPADEPDEDSWMNVRAQRDSDGKKVIVGTSVQTDPDEVQSRVEVRYWPGDDSRVVSMVVYTAAVGEAHRLAMDATSVHRAPQPIKGENDGPQTPPQKNQLEILLEKHRRLKGLKVSDDAESMSPAALDAIEGIDEESGGSDERD